MPVDISLDELKKYKLGNYKEKDFDEFWENKLEKIEDEPLNIEIKKISYLIKKINANKIYYDGYDGAKICGYYLTPKSKKPFPALLWFHGYGSNKQKISYYLSWVLLGYAVLAIDIRGQCGESLDNKIYQGPSVCGYTTKGIFDKENYYYLGVYLDGVKAIKFLENQKEIDINRIGIIGFSQGGGIALAVSALNSRAILTIAEIPYICYFPEAIKLAEEHSNIMYLEIANIIKKLPERKREIFKTLSYFDNLNLCNRIKNRTIISCALRDTACPPSTIFAVYNNITAEKDIDILEFYDHSWDTLIKYQEKRLEHIIKYL